MEQIMVRKATLKDMDTLLVFEQGVIQAERPFDSTLQSGHINYYDLKGMMVSPHIHLVVAELGDEIIGSGYARIENAKPYLKHKQHAYLGFMYVLSAHRGKGVNMKIIEALKEWSVSQNVTEMRLEVYPNNLSAIYAYEKAGFTGYMLQMRLGLEE